MFTNFFFFGAKFSLEFLFHMFFLVQYCRSLEEGSFRGRTADFFFMILFGATLLTLVAPFAQMHFLGSSLTFMMVYIWARRNPFGQHSCAPESDATADAHQSTPALSWIALHFAHSVRFARGMLCFLDSVRMSFLGLFTFTAPYLPWVLLSFSFLLGNDGQLRPHHASSLALLRSGVSTRLISPVCVCRVVPSYG